jgi:hypothetical protein
MMDVKKDLAAEYKPERDVVRIEHYVKAARDFIFMWIWPGDELMQEGEFIESIRHDEFFLLESVSSTLL